MLTRRIIPCLDVKDGQVVKGIRFENLVREGDPVELAARYSDEGADELVFLDITATLESREHVVELVRKVAKKVFIPFTVGGGIRTIEDILQILEAGADKVSINSAALKDPQIIQDASERFGSQCIVLAVDVKRERNSWYVYSHGGTSPTDKKAVNWVVEVVSRGAGEILLTSMDADGTQNGVDLEITHRVSQAVDVPVIASGGIGKLSHFKDAIIIGEADAVLAASVFHRNIFSIEQVKTYLANKEIPVRIGKTQSNHEIFHLIDWTKSDQGLIPAIIQDVETGEVLMLAYMNRESLAISMAEGYTCFWSRSRRVLWRKGETSGHLQKIRAIHFDCDRDTLLIKVEQAGPACHLGTRSCFSESFQISDKPRRFQ